MTPSVNRLPNLFYTDGPHGTKILSPLKTSAFVGFTLYLLPKGVSWLCTLPSHDQNNLSSIDKLRKRCALIEEKIGGLWGEGWLVIKAINRQLWFGGVVISYLALSADKKFTLEDKITNLANLWMISGVFVIARGVISNCMSRENTITRAIGEFVYPLKE